MRSRKGKIVLVLFALVKFLRKGYHHIAKGRVYCLHECSVRYELCECRAESLWAPPHIGFGIFAVCERRGYVRVDDLSDERECVERLVCMLNGADVCSVHLAGICEDFLASSQK